MQEIKTLGKGKGWKSLLFKIDLVSVHRDEDAVHLYHDAWRGAERGGKIVSLPTAAPVVQKCL